MEREHSFSTKSKLTLITLAENLTVSFLANIVERETKSIKYLLICKDKKTC